MELERRMGKTKDDYEAELNKEVNRLTYMKDSETVALLRQIDDLLQEV